MSSKAEKERTKLLQDKFQAILSSLLKDDDNKYCVDCDAKGPRWASWNLGIFLCIRCAGIHRNLGVHISRVKSVNLDTWTPEQVAMMQEVGNSRARAAYEANIPDSFRRPQTDSRALEAFIRAKYEHKKYLAREWVPPKPTIPKEPKSEWLEDDREKKRSKSKPASTIQLSSVPKSSASSSSSSREKKSSPEQAKSPTKSPPPVQQPQPSTAAADLIGLETYYMSQNASSPTSQQPNGGGDLLADIFGNTPNPTQPAQPVSGGAGAALGVGANQTQGGQQNGTLEANLFEDAGTDKGGSEKSTKESILALYGSGGSGGGQQQQPQMFGVPATSAPSSGDLLQFTPSQAGLLPTPSQLSVQSAPHLSTNQMSSSQISTNQQMFHQPMTQPQMCLMPQGLFYYDAGGMYMPQQNMGMYGGAMPGQQGMQYQQGMMGMQQPNMYGMGQM
ncbi:LOW QUALITY PROTEIN: stromal membrane-associated protein 1-like [Haliotis rubra]|uniref:LOW QUALITY PROTEIN: stromal membrane-associated protein 1-like n=1 Tax=Haliotis rubra TaxID=36100 RepID=UPI001EE6075F|nr:LOW QUALITY PROTEIN: stromal membrane-associated protein 1-like [Haliotis rubra]